MPEKLTGLCRDAVLQARVVNKITSAMLKPNTERNAADQIQRGKHRHNATNVEVRQPDEDRKMVVVKQTQPSIQKKARVICVGKNAPSINPACPYTDP